MIRFADKTTEPEIRRMWEACFDDSPAFVDFYFSEKYRNENTLLYSEGGAAVASLQMIPYQFSFYGEEVSSLYISGACTLPEWRNRGYMGKLLSEAFGAMRKKHIPLSILIPAEDWLYGYYARYGYAAVFEKDEEFIPLKEIISASGGNMDKAYLQFDSLFRNKDFCVQKTKTDFTAIVKDAELDGFPPKSDLSGMARVIDAEKLIGMYAKGYRGNPFSFELQDSAIPDNNGVFHIEGNGLMKFDKGAQFDEKLTVRQLCRLLFGFHLEQLSGDIVTHFQPHSPCMNLMLE
ncbi:GNAT family N-acetyltransferase [Paludibacter sp. 221]|uniref:GNAT family N-acetyltransferase n=1 Tax=Paludibacter sp. 221 TaxID=2302939 RepID=UPI0013D8651A|nr:GNAT family N-acetyltransferase [Paludibacter sp. 221]NDV45439.1 GNAT family N-acetyltransferase [Paludibacter sp. 221]